MTRTEAAPEEFAWFLGVDWGTATHAVEITDAQGHVVGTRMIEHSHAGLAQWIEWLRTQTVDQLSQVAAAIEVPRGAVVELLLERGVTVFAVNPKQLDRFRDRFSVAGAKDDRLDAHVLASAVRTDRALFRRLQVDEPLVIQLRELTRASAIVQEDLQAGVNRLRALVHRIAPAWLTLSPNADDAWFWTLLAQAAKSAWTRPVPARVIAKVLAEHRIRRVSAEEVGRVLATPLVVVAPGTRDAVATHVQLLLPRLRLLADQQRACTKALEATIAALAASDAADRDDERGIAGPGDVAIVRSTPGIGVKVLATLLADVRALLRTRDYAALRTISGAAPVRRQSGKHRGLVSMRYGCNQRVRQACYHWARASLTVDAAAKAYYASLRARGHSHGRALRSVADRWLRILVAMLKTRTLYDATRFPLAGSPPATALA